MERRKYRITELEAGYVYECDPPFGLINGLTFFYLVEIKSNNYFMELSFLTAEGLLKVSWSILATYEFMKADE